MRDTPDGERAGRMLETFDDLGGPAPFMGLVLASLILLDALVWAIRAWGAHRVVLRKRRWHCAAAMLLTLAILGMSLVFPAWVGVAALPGS